MLKSVGRRDLSNKLFPSMAEQRFYVFSESAPCPLNKLTIYLSPTFVHWLLFIRKIFISSTCFEPQVLIFRRIQLYTCSIWYCHSLWEFLVACRYTAHAVYLQATKNSHREWQYHMLHVYNCILLKMSTWASKHVEEINILWINNNQCTKVGD